MDSVLICVRFPESSTSGDATRPAARPPQRCTKRRRAEPAAFREGVVERERVRSYVIEASTPISPAASRSTGMARSANASSTRATGPDTDTAVGTGAPGTDIA